MPRDDCRASDFYITAALVVVHYQNRHSTGLDKYIEKVLTRV